MRDESAATTAVVVLTWNRKDLLRDLLHAVCDWDDVDHIVVVDNAGTDGSTAMIHAEFPRVHVVRTDDNLGATGGRNVGLRAAAELGCAYAFLAEDDTVPKRDAFVHTRDVVMAIDDAALVGTSGGSFHRGLISWGRVRDRRDVCGVQVGACDFVLFDSCCVRIATLRDVGYLREDFFIMFEEPELGYRLRAAHCQVLCASIDVMRLHEGSRSSSRANPWRSYYQTRNHLRFALDQRSPVLLLGFAMRITKQLAYETAMRRFRSVRMRLRGVNDARRNRMGRTVEPAQ